MFLSEIMYDMDFLIEKSEHGYKVFDLQTKEYRLNYDDGEEFTSAEEIIDRFEIYFTDYWFREVEDVCGAKSWKELYDEALRCPHKFEYEQPIEVLDCLVHPEKLQGILAA